MPLNLLSGKVATSLTEKESHLLNNLPVTLERLALSDSTGEISFSTGADMLNRIARDGDAAVKVPCMTLDDYCESRGIEHIQFIKIDVEGAEHLVFRGAKRMLSLVDTIQLEMADSVRAFDLEREDIRDMLASYGFQLYTYNGTLRPVENLSSSPQNIFAICDIGEVRARVTSLS